MDLNSSVKVLIALAPAVRTANTAVTGPIIDRNGYGTVEFAVVAGAIADGSSALALDHGDAANLSDAAAVSADLLGSAPTFGTADAASAQRFGYKGLKRYLRVKSTQSGATTGGCLGVVAILGSPRYAPVT